MLLDDSQVALNDVIAACTTSAEVHEWAAQHADRAPLRDIAGRIGARRRRDVDELCARMRAADILPKLPDPEAAGFQAALTGLKALASTAFTDESRETMRRALDDAETALGGCVAGALGFAQPDRVAAFLDELARDVTAHRDAPGQG